MKCLLFTGGRPYQAVDSYNKWAANKRLARDVIVHSHVVTNPTIGEQTLAIVVFFDQAMHPDWVGENDT